jgi:nucleoside 2-deoxyribosyltransferase
VRVGLFPGSEAPRCDIRESTPPLLTFFLGDTMRIYLICPVRGCDEATRKEMDAYVNWLEGRGHMVHYPPRDVDQSLSGPEICECHREAIINADAVHVWWNSTSIGSHFDFGMAYALKKPIYAANALQPLEHKSYVDVLMAEHDRTRQDPNSPEI